MARQASSSPAIEPALPGARVKVRDEIRGDVKVRRKVTQRKAFGGVGLLIVFVMVMVAVIVAIAMPAVARVGGALILVLFLGLLIRLLNQRYDNEVERRIQTARDQARKQQMVRARKLQAR